MGLMKKLTSVVVTAGLLLGLVGTAFAAYPADSAASAKRMQDLGIVQGDAGGLRLGDSITRAELIKVIVWAFGKGNDAKFLKGAPAFPDTANHWASGEIALAKNMIEANGFKLGLPDGTFNPQANVTAAEAVAMVMKFLGAPADASQAWPNDYLSGAVAAGILTADDKATVAGVANAPATRGLVFYLADTAFSSYKLSSGKTVYTQYVRPTAPTLTIDEVAPTTDSSVTVTGSVSSVYTDPFVVTVGSSTNVATVSGGKFTATVSDLAMGDNNVSVMVTDEAGNVVTKTVKVTRTVGAAASIEAPATLSVAAGESADLAVVVKDAKGNAISNAPVTVTSTLGSFADGKFTAGSKTGTETVTVASGDLTASVALTVNAGALASIAITPATINLSAGTTQKFTAVGKDAAGNEVALSSVKWDAGNKGVMGNDGTFAATADAAGTVTITATSGSASGTATVNVFGVATKVVLAAPAAIVSNGKATGTLTATVVDANGNVAQNYNGTVTFASSNTEAVSVDTATVSAVNGVASTTTTAGDNNGAGTAATTVLSASASGLAGSTQTLTTTAQVATSISLTASTATMAASSTSSSKDTLTLKYLDQTGVAMLAVPSSQVTVQLTSSNPSVGYFSTPGTATTSIAMSAVSKTVDLLATSTVGATTVTGAVTSPSGSTVTVGSVAVNTMVVGDANKLSMDAIDSEQVGTDTTVTWRVLDYNGNQLTGTNGNIDGFKVTATDSDGNSTDIATVSTVNGVGSKDFTESTADTYTIKVTHATYGTVTGTVAFTASDAYKVVLSASPSKIAADGVAQSVLKVKVEDVNSNVVTTGSYSVTIAKTSGSATVPFSSTVVTTSNGVATVPVIGTTTLGTDSFTATASGLIGGVATVQTAIFGSPYKVGFATSSTDGTAPAAVIDGTAGTDTTVYVGVQDYNSNLLTNDNGRAVTLTVKNVSGTVLGTFTGTTVNGIASINVNLTAANNLAAYTYSLSAASGALNSASIAATSDKSAGLRISAASASTIALSADRATLSANGSQATITAKLKDQYGNTVTVADLAGVDVYLKVTSGTTASFGKVDGNSEVKLTIAKDGTSASTVDNADPTKSTSLVSTTSSGAVVVSGRTTAAGVSNGTVTVNTVITGDPNAMTIDAISSVKVQATPGDLYGNSQTSYQTITIRMVDGAGQPVTGYTGTVKLVATSGVNGSIQAFTSAKGGVKSSPFGVGVDWTVSAVKGVATFYVQDDLADSVTYTVTTDDLPKTYSVTAVGAFTPLSATKVAVQASTPAKVNADGVQLDTVTAWVVDSLTNKVTTASGTMTFSIVTGSDYATLLQTTAPIVNGVASVVAQTKAVPGSEQLITVQASADVNADGTNETSTGGTFTVVGSYPAIVTWVAPDAAAKPALSIKTTDFFGIASVKFQYKKNADVAWIDAATVTTGALDVYSYTFASALDAGTKYDFQAIITDKVGRTITTSTVSQTTP